MTYILGLNCYHADSSACLLKDGKVLIALEEERINRIKHWAGFPALSIKKCLEFEGINIDNVDEALKLNPFGIDVSSGVEKSLGLKSNEKIIKFLNKIKNVKN